MHEWVSIKVQIAPNYKIIQPINSYRLDRGDIDSGVNRLPQFLQPQRNRKKKQNKKEERSYITVDHYKQH